MNDERQRAVDVLAEALASSNLIPRYRDYANQLGMQKDSVDDLALTWAHAILDELPDGWTLTDGAGGPEMTKKVRDDAVTALVETKAGREIAPYLAAAYLRGRPDRTARDAARLAEQDIVAVEREAVERWLRNRSQPISEDDPWPPLNQGTLRDRLTTARDGHAYAAGRVGLPPEGWAGLVVGYPSLDDFRRWHRECAGWYDEMLRQLDVIEGEATEHQNAELTRLREALDELLNGPQGIVQGDEHGNPVCRLCGSHLDGEYAHRDRFACDKAAALLAQAEADR